MGCILQIRKRESVTECRKSQISTRVTHLSAITHLLCRNVRALSKLPFHVALVEISAAINYEINKKSTKRKAFVVKSKKKFLRAWPSGVASKGTVHCNK